MCALAVPRRKLVFAGKGEARWGKPEAEAVLRQCRGGGGVGGGEGGGGAAPTHHQQLRGAPWGSQTVPAPGGPWDRDECSSGFIPAAPRAGQPKFETPINAKLPGKPGRRGPRPRLSAGVITLTEHCPASPQPCGVQVRRVELEKAFCVFSRQTSRPWCGLPQARCSCEVSYLQLGPSQAGPPGAAGGGPAPPTTPGLHHQWLALLPGLLGLRCPQEPWGCSVGL